MTGWTGGYVADVEYSGLFYHSQSPGHLALACLLAGVEPPRFEHGFAYCELGCGQGITTALLAAANPAGRFYGVDFNPSHIARARDAAVAAGLTNVEFAERSFAELAEAPDGQLPDFDFIAMHGVYTWVSRANQQAIAAFLRRRLKPGGIVYIAWNCLPGWSAAMPIQRLLYDIGAQHPERSDVRAERAFAEIEGLARAGLPHLAGNDFLAEIRGHLGSPMMRYVVHEHMNEDWRPLYFTELARDLAEVKLDFVASADLIETFPSLLLRPEPRAAIDRFPPAIREMLKDFALDRRFRRDVFARGARPIGQRRRDDLLRGSTFALAVPRGSVSLKLKVPAGDAAMDPATYGPVFDALAERPHRIGELLDGTGASRGTTPAPVELAALLATSLQALPIVAAPDVEPAKRFNRSIAASFRHDEPGRRYALAAGRLGTGLLVNPIQLIVYDAVAGGRTEPNDLAAHLDTVLSERGDVLSRDGQPIRSADERHAAIRENLDLVLHEFVPLWRALEMI
jgi:SAM-dependent methyltransferase